MDNNEKQRRYNDSGETIITSEIDRRTKNEIADDNYDQALEGAKQFQEELYREVLIARGVDPDEVNIGSLIAGKTTMDEVVKNYKSKH